VTKPPPLVELVLRTELAPALRKLGFKKELRNFRRSTAAALQIINVQSSAGNFEDRASFTVNLGLYFPEVPLAFGEPVDTSPPEYACHIRSRIGRLLAGPDHWWEVHSEKEALATARQISSAVLGVGLPWLDAAATHADAAVVCANASLPGHSVVLAFAAGDLNAAEEHLGRALTANSPYRDRLKSWSRSKGLSPRLVRV
jgi:Domain of unknown function (DUF4304)